MNVSSMAIIMFILILVGYVARKLQIVDETFGQSLSMFLYNFVFPAIIITSMNIPFEAEELKNSTTLILISIVYLIAMFVLGSVFKFLSKKKDTFSGIMTFGLMFPNFTFMAYPVMETLFPDRGLFYISMFTIPVRLIVYVAGPLLMVSKGDKVPGRELFKNSIKALLTPPVLAVPVGLLVYFLDISIPTVILSSLDFLGKTATPMGMAVTGILLAETPIRKMFVDKRLFLLTALKLIAAPLIMFFILINFNLNPIVLQISVIYAALPVAASTTVVAIQNKSDSFAAASSVFLTTALSILTVPACAYILQTVV